MKLKDFYTIPELAKMLGMSRIAVYKKVKNGTITAIRIGRNFAIASNQLENILGRSMTAEQKKIIDRAVKKTVREYGEVLKKLGSE